MKNAPGTVWTDKKRTLFGLPISFTRYILTEKKLVTRKGFLNVKEDELELYRVSDKSLNLPLGQRIFGCGTIILNCKDVDTPVKEIISVKKPREVSELIEKYVDIQRDKYYVRGKDVIGSFHDGNEHYDIDNDDHNYNHNN
jgi:hypothetical protein